MSEEKSVAERCLQMTSLFEAELLVSLMLRYWNHPLADDDNFANALLEGAAEALRTAAAGGQLIDAVPPADLNFVAAIWYVENCAVESETSATEEIKERAAWLAAVRKALPSCFCDPSDLT